MKRRPAKGFQNLIVLILELTIAKIFDSGSKRVLHIAQY